eukprot:5741942-Pyramimonas_sp.AAC.1
MELFGNRDDTRALGGEATQEERQDKEVPADFVDRCPLLYLPSPACEARQESAWTSERHQRPLPFGTPMWPNVGLKSARVIVPQPLWKPL